MEIRDPRSGQGAFVNSQGQALSQGIIESRQAYITLAHGMSWTFTGEALDPTGANDYVFYLRNDDDDFFVAVTRINMRCITADTVVEVQGVTGTPASGTAVTPRNRNRRSSKTPNVTIQTGVDITGLTEVGILESFSLAAASASAFQRVDLTNSPIILGEGTAIAFLVAVATAVVTFQIDFDMRKLDY